MCRLIIEIILFFIRVNSKSATACSAIATSEKTGGPVFFILSKNFISSHTNYIFYMM